MNSGFTQQSNPPPNVFQKSKQTSSFNGKTPSVGFQGFNQPPLPQTYTSGPSNQFSNAGFGGQPFFNASPALQGAGQQGMNASTGFRPTSSVPVSAFGMLPQTTQTPPFNSSPGSSFPSHTNNGANNRQPASAFSMVPSGNAFTKKERKQDKKEEKPSRRERKREKDRSARRAAPTLPHFPHGTFVDRPRPENNEIAILKPLPKPLTEFTYRRDDWDVRNQEALMNIERQYLEGRRSLQSAYEEMSKMREVERSEMERRGLVDNTEVRKNLTDAIQFMGSCLEMCPVFERVRRAHENNALSLEKNSEGKVVSQYAVKAFSRPAAGQPPPLPSDVRPPSILVSTLNYLVQNILPKLPASHPFLWDRTRSIRQDFTYQNYQGSEAMWSFEVIARIHCVSLHRMAKALNEGGEWSQQQELEQFNKCLQSLSEFYQSQPLVSQNEAEMRAYQILSHFFDDEMVAMVDRLPAEIYSHPFVTLALELRNLPQVSVPKFFERIRQPDIPPTFRAVAEVHYNKLRMQAIRQLLESMHKRMHMYSLDRFIKLLGFETVEEARAFCNHFDLTISYSEEAGEEVDVRSWEENNVKDKRPLPQSYDPSLDLIIENFDVLSPPLIASTSVSIQGKTASAFPRPQSVPRKFDPMAAVFKPTAQPSQTNVPSPKFAFGSPASVTPQDTLAKNAGKPFNSVNQDEISKQQEEEHLKLKKQLEIEEQRRKDEERLEQQRLKQQQQEMEEKQQRLQQEKLRQQQRQQQLEIQRREEETRRQQAIEAQREQELKSRHQQEHQRRVDMRNVFIENNGKRILSALLETVCMRECVTAAKAVKLYNRRILLSAFSSMKEFARREANLRIEKERRDRELQDFKKSFQGRKRVVSNRGMLRPNDNTFSELAYQSNESSDSMRSVVSTGRKVSSHPRPPSSLDLTPLFSLLKNAYSCGLRQLRFLADWNSASGRWLQDTIQLDCFVHVGPGIDFKLTSTTQRDAIDVVIVDKGYDMEYLAESTFCVSDAAKLKSLRQLRLDIEEVLHKFLKQYELKLISHRSLNIKRRRVSVEPDQSNGAAAEISTHAYQNERIALAKRESVAANARKLRYLIAETQRLANET